MDIRVTKGIGEGSTELAAFDAALFDAGIANYNLIRLSSVIPDGARILREKINKNDQEFGYRLYTVYSCHTESEQGRQAWAGIGWVQAETGKGLFVEHHGASEEEVRDLITSTLNDMTKYRKDNFGPIQYEIAGTKCGDKPICALVVAVYGSQRWD
jgi:arginine decarboxylase